MNHPYTEKDIIRYVRGMMDVNETTAFEEKVKTNDLLNREVEEMKVTIQLIDQNGEQELRHRFEKLEQGLTLKKWFKWALLFAALIAVGIVIKNVLNDNKSNIPKEIYAQHFEKYRAPIVVRNSENIELEQDEAIDAYRKNQFTIAFEKFTLLCSETNKEACFYAHLSAIYENKTVPEQVRNQISDNKAYVAILLWHEALMNIKLGNTSESIRLLNSLIENGNYKTKEANSILVQLNQMNE
ncbi:MAG: hypothetical protein P1U56_13060 [Saprospiraceae bacterium]|nr:hypothetical protein [Saprospiraceae bacterium]